MALVWYIMPALMWTCVPVSVVTIAGTLSIYFLRRSRGRPPAHGNAPRVCGELIWHAQMGGRFSQEVNFRIVPYFFSFLGIAGCRLLTMAGNPLDVNGLGAQIVVHYLAEVHVCTLTCEHDRTWTLELHYSFVSCGCSKYSCMPMAARFVAFLTP